jgi:DNA-binding beta-propeller fold protein YncE
MKVGLRAVVIAMAVLLTALPAAEFVSGLCAATGVTGKGKKNTPAKGAGWFAAPRRAKKLWTAGGGRTHGKAGPEGVYDIALDERAGLLYVPSSGRRQVHVLAADSGRLLRTLGKEGDGPGLFLRPRGVDVDDYGNVYVVDSVRGTIQVWNGSGAFLREVTPEPPGVRLERYPELIDVAVERRTGNLYVADKANKAVWVLGSDGRFLRLIGGAGRDRIHGLRYIRLSPEGEVTVGVRRRVAFFTRNGRESRREYGMRRQDKRLSSTRGFDFDREGNLLVIGEDDEGERYVTGFHPDGRILFRLVDRTGGKSLPIGSALTLAVSSKDRIFVVEKRDRVTAFRILDPVPERPRQMRSR